MAYTAAFSPCPNDTFIFYAWAHGLLPDAPEIVSKLADVQNLNAWALEARYPLTKLSFSCFGKVMEDYILLPSGCALGHGCGPMVVSRTACAVDELSQCRVAVPGKDTTAYLLLCSLVGEPANPIFCQYDEVVSKVQTGEADAGVIIHETRFVISDTGLEQVCDLGELWEKQTTLPIPLGGLAVYRRLDPEVLSALALAARRSVEYARAHPEEARPYMQSHAIEKDAEIIQRHLDLYVNEETVQISSKGCQAVERLLEVGRRHNILPSCNKPWLLDVPTPAALCD